ncbi:zinc finger protein RFP-like [Rhineura floridana]|uniref:zinc finger protein RFP-like n=1 Tax=Rhineura floridana TaxID=261503 RepID=UPI002AC7F867|nr:zinc finger protein RFP-like [Rhineura floridana]
MAEERSRKRFRYEATCPVCLGYFASPVMLDCGHSFCQTCIVRCWEASGADARCPECRRTVERNFKPNRSLSNLVEILSEWVASAEREAWKRRSECRWHQQPLDLFCKDDHTPFCRECGRSQEHSGHRVVPVEEIARVCKSEICRWLENLKEDRAKILAYKADTENEWQHLCKETKSKKQKIMDEFGRLHRFLKEQEQLLLKEMEGVENEIARKRDEHLARISRELSSLKNIVQELEEKLQQPACAILEDLKSTLDRYKERAMFGMPVVFSAALKWRVSEFCDINPFMEGVIRQFKDTLVSELPQQKANITLDPDTAHPQLILSENRRSVRWEDTSQELPENPQRFDQLTVVLGCDGEGFTAGRHSWEVVVGKEGEWGVGVARKSLKRKGKFSFTPEEGIWAMGKWKGRYRPLDRPRSCLCMTVELKRIGVTVNYAGQRVAFFDADTGNQLLVFAKASFSGETLLPFFWLGKEASLALSPVAG